LGLAGLETQKALILYLVQLLLLVVVVVTLVTLMLAQRQMVVQVVEQVMGTPTFNTALAILLL